MSTLPDRSDAPSAVVVGGGLAGITAALVLGGRGWAVTLVEAKPRLGGRATSFSRDGWVVDNGQHVFLRCCTAYRGLLDRLGAGPGSGMTTLQDRLDIPLRSAADGTEGVLRRTNAPAPLHLAGSLGRYGLLSLADRARLGGTALALRLTDPADPTADERGFGRFLRHHGQSSAAVNRLWSVISTATLNIDPEDASLALTAKVFRTGLLERRDGADLGYALVPLGRIHDDLARDALTKAGVTVLTGVKAQPLDKPEPGARAGVRIAGRGGDVRTLTADAVVLAVPHDVAAHLLPAPHPTAFTELGHSPIVNLHLRYDRTVMDRPFLATVDSPAQWIFDRTDSSRSGYTRAQKLRAAAGSADPGAGRGGDEPGSQYLAVTVSAADAYVDLPTARLAEIFGEELKRVLPKTRTAELTDFFVTRERHATFRQARGTARFRPGPRTGAPSVYLAGAWTATGWPDTMESAVRSGLIAAKCALDSAQTRTPGPKTGAQT
ncbi:MAG TPA: hydroxysqualene dehydroxylase HpnE [Actinocrinis sp.]|nr:hydroxysqualene dehydroxylase HpnE [Actinocrinis sp.]